MLRLDGIVFTLINLLILYIALRHFLIRPVQEVLEKRKELVAKQFSEAQEKEDAANEMKAQYTELLANAKSESVRMIEESRKTAQKEYEQKLAEAETQAGRILEKAQQDAALEQEKAVGKVQAQIAQVAMAAAGKILRQNTDSAANQSIYEQYIGKVGESHGADGN